MKMLVTAIVGAKVSTFKADLSKRKYLIHNNAA
jgi:hypothetical protein